MNILRNNGSSVLIATMMNNPKAVGMKRLKAKLQYKKPRIAVYSKEGKDFWCD